MGMKHASPLNRFGLTLYSEITILSGAPAECADRRVGNAVCLRGGEKKTMETETKCCTVCGVEIPKERLEVIPDTLVCVRCSRKMGGEFELKVRVGGTGKVGSLKITGQEVSVTRQRRRFV